MTSAGGRVKRRIDRVLTGLIHGVGRAQLGYIAQSLACSMVLEIPWRDKARGVYDGMRRGCTTPAHHDERVEDGRAKVLAWGSLE